MKGYWIAKANIKDRDTFKRYSELAGPAITKHGGKFLARGGKSETLEGNDFERIVIIEFKDYDSAKKCFNSPEYQKALTFSKKSSIRDLCLVEGQAD